MVEHYAGHERSQLIVDGLTRTQIVQYAGASGDFNPIHTDEVFVRERAGFPTVFAHGMLIMGMTTRVLTDWFGPTSIRRLGSRFHAQVWPGDSLTARAVVAEVEQTSEGDPQLTITLETTNQDGLRVLSGAATVDVITTPERL